MRWRAASRKLSRAATPSSRLGVTSSSPRGHARRSRCYLTGDVSQWASAPRVSQLITARVSLGAQESRHKTQRGAGASMHRAPFQLRRADFDAHPIADREPERVRPQVATHQSSCVEDTDAGRAPQINGLEPRLTTFHCVVTTQRVVRDPHAGGSLVCGRVRDSASIPSP